MSRMERTLRNPVDDDEPACEFGLHRALHYPVRQPRTVNGITGGSTRVAGRHSAPDIGRPRAD